MARLRTYVHVPNDSGQFIEYGPESGDIPEDVAEKITNPSVWEGAEDIDPDTGAILSIPVPDPVATDPVADPDATPGEDDEDDDEPDPLIDALNKEQLSNLAEEYEAEGLDSKATKAEIVAALRAAGYEGDGSEVE